MAIHFSKERFEQIADTYTSWFDHKLDRIVTGVIIPEHEPDGPVPPAPQLSQATCADLSWTPEQLADRVAYELSRNEYYGDAYPSVNMDAFGPGVVSAFLGANLDNSTGNVWFHPAEEKEIADLHFTYDPENPWLVRVRNVCEALVDRLEDRALVSMPDLGGILDILAVFRPGEQLLMDLYDAPEEVQRLTEEIHAVWMEVYSDLNSVLHKNGLGYTDWSGIYSDKPSYILQSDFCYMISPSSFDEFVFDDARKMCNELERSVWHLDGVGELKHLDKLLSIDRLNGVQWVPGAGQPPCEEWMDVYHKIADAGKVMQICYSGFPALDQIARGLGSTRGLQHPSLAFAPEQKDEALSWLKKFRVI